MASAVTAVTGFLRDLPSRRRLTALLLGVNALGTVYGFWWYRDQLALTPVAAWPLVPDSPSSTLLFTLFLAAFLRGRPPQPLAAFAYLTSIKYGLWTPAVMVGYWLAAGTADFESVHLTLSHLGMALEALVFMRVCPVSPAWAVLAASWLLFNDYADYGRGLHPFLPWPGLERYAGTAAVTLSLASLALAVAWPRWLGRPHTGGRPF